MSRNRVQQFVRSYSRLSLVSGSLWLDAVQIFVMNYWNMLLRNAEASSLMECREIYNNLTVLFGQTKFIFS